MSAKSADEKHEMFSKKRSLSFAEDVEINTLGDIIFYLFFNGSTVGKTFSVYKRVSNKPQKTGQARSIEDCFLLAKHYFPEITYKQVQDAVTLFYDVTKNTKLNSMYRTFDYKLLGASWCCTVNRTVHSSILGNRGLVTIDDINKNLDSKNLNYETRRIPSREEIQIS